MKEKNKWDIQGIESKFALQVEADDYVVDDGLGLFLIFDVNGFERISHSVPADKVIVTKV